MPKFDPDAAHQQRPKLRPVRGFPAKVGEQVLLGLSDAKQISDKMVVTSPAVQGILPLMNGERSIDDIAREVGRGLTVEMVQMLVAQLDDAGLLFGPRFEAMLAKMRADFDATPVLPPGSSAAFADALANHQFEGKATDEQKAEHGPARLRAIFDEWMNKTLEKAENPSFDELPRAILVPHIDYPRGWLNYAAAWGRMRVSDRPERVIILGTNHFGQGTGVVGCDKGYESPLGVCRLDEGFAAAMRRRLGDKLFEHRFDHEREHSIELQVAWVQHCMGKDEKGEFPKVWGALVHDPAVNNGESYDGKGIGILPFVEALRETIGELPGRTLVVSSADLSHVGPMFGDKQNLAGETPEAEGFRNKVLQHDQEMLAHVKNNDPEALVAAMAWQQNPTRWCSTGNIVAMLMAVKPARVEMLNYAAAMDQGGNGMVSSAAAAMW